MCWLEITSYLSSAWLQNNSLILCLQHLERRNRHLCLKNNKGRTAMWANALSFLESIRQSHVPSDLQEKSWQTWEHSNGKGIHWLICTHLSLLIWPILDVPLCWCRHWRTTYPYYSRTSTPRKCDTSFSLHNCCFLFAKRLSTWCRHTWKRNRKASKRLLLLVSRVIEAAWDQSFRLHSLWSPFFCHSTLGYHQKWQETKKDPSLWSNLTVFREDW